MYWKKMSLLRDKFYEDINTLDEEMQKDFNISELEFFWSDGSIDGIGNQWADESDKRDLMQWFDLEKK